MIILIGFPKSGTSSFQKLFTDIGYKSYHWKKGNNYIGKLIYNNKINNKPLLNDFLKMDVITQMDICIDEKNAHWPQITDYKQLYIENPGAVFILNKREPKALLDSFKRWGKMNERLYKYNPELLSDNTDEGFIDFVNKHYKDVEDFFSSQSNSKFLTYHIVNDNINKLKKYINIKHFKKFPMVNVNSNKRVPNPNPIETTK
jgi:hypothetical protein